MDNGSLAKNVSIANMDISEIYAFHVSATIDRCVTPVFYIIGLPANPLCAYIWLHRKTRANNSSAIYLGALSISHVVFLCLHLLQELRYAWTINTYDGHVSCEIYNMVFFIPQYLAPLLVLGFTVERYIAICHPFAKERYCTVWRAKVVVSCLFAFCVIISAMQAYFWTFDERNGICNHRIELQKSPFIEIWTWLTELLIFGVVPLAALLFNILVIHEIRQLTSGGPAHAGASGSSQASTVTLLSVSFYLICTWLPYTIIYCMSKQFPIGDFPITMEGVETDATWQRHFLYVTIKNVIAEVTLSNSACYFFIYYATGKHFRDKVHDLLCPRPCIKSSNVNQTTKSVNHFNGTTATSV